LEKNGTMLKDSVDNNEKWKFEVYPGHGQDWWIYYSHYKVAVDELVKLIEENLAVNTVAFPTLFLIRHSLELGLKANILRFEQVSSAKSKLNFKNPKSHSLEFLYDIFNSHLIEITGKLHLDQKVIDKLDYYQKNIQPLKILLNELDKGSYSFRYPVDTNRKVNFEWNKRIQLDEILKLFYAIQPFILWTEAVLDEYGVFYQVDNPPDI
jgi:hypothetical protein